MSAPGRHLWSCRRWCTALGLVALSIAVPLAVGDLRQESRTGRSNNDEEMSASARNFRARADPVLQDAYKAAMAFLREHFEDYAEKLFHVQIGEPDENDNPPSWLSKNALRNMAKAMIACKENGKPFVVAVGGASIAAGRSNLPSESYASVARSFMEPVFKAAGVELEVRDQGTGGTKSAPASFCTKCIYGDDAHVVSYHHGLHDVREYDLLIFWAKHVMNGPNKPTALVGYRGGAQPLYRGKIVENFSRSGWPIGEFVDGLSEIEDLLPGKEVADDELPAWLQGLQDVNKLARRKDTKYSDAANAACDGHPQGASAWHPGYREHRLVGYMYSMPILVALREAFLGRSLDTLDYEQPEDAPLCTVPECKVSQYECRSCFYPRAPNVERDQWDIGSLIIKAEDASLRESFGGAASTTWEAGCRFEGSDPTNAPEPDCLGTVDGQGFVSEDCTQSEKQFLLLRLPFEGHRDSGTFYELSVVICEETCFGSCEDTREILEDAFITFDGRDALKSQKILKSSAVCLEVVRAVHSSENHAILGIKNQTPGKTVRVTAIAWGLRERQPRESRYT